jgi:hypothetical protein
MSKVLGLKLAQKCGMSVHPFLMPWVGRDKKNENNKTSGKQTVISNMT